jgi:hypothetical protein
MPSFRHTVVALNFGGPLAAKVKLTLMKRQGVRSFAEGSNPCDLPGQAVVCFSFGKPYHSDPFSSSAYGSSYGSRGGGASNGASESGEFAGSTIYAVLIAADGEMFELGEASSSAFAGQSSGYGSSNGVSFNSSFSSTATISPSTAIAIAQQRAISKFVDPRWWKKLDQTTTVQWFPGAAEAVREAFPR